MKATITIPNDLLRWLDEAREKMNNTRSGYIGYLLRSARAGVTHNHIVRHTTPLSVAILASGISQKELAAKAGISPQTMSRIVRGETRPRRDTARLIARALGHPVTTLFPTLHSLN